MTSSASPTEGPQYITASYRVIESNSHSGHAEGHFMEAPITSPEGAQAFISIDAEDIYKVEPGHAIAVRHYPREGFIPAWKTLLFPRGGTITGPANFCPLGARSDDQMISEAKRRKAFVAALQNTKSALLFALLVALGLVSTLIFNPAPQVDIWMAYKPMIFAFISAACIFPVMSYFVNRDLPVDVNQKLRSTWRTAER